MSSYNKKYTKVNNKEYNVNENVLIGNFYDYTGEYEAQIKSTKILSPYYHVPVNWKGKGFPSLVNYLYFFRLCYKDLKEKLYTMKPKEVPAYYYKNKNKCEKLFKNIGDQIGINKFETVKSYIIRITKDALDVLYDIYMRNSDLKASLLATEYLPIYFVDRDEILGDGLDGSGLNLFGKKLEEIRKYLKENVLRDSLVETKIKTLETLNLQFNNSSDFTSYSNDKFNNVEKWAYKMLLMYSNAIASFFEYLCISRNEFMPINTEINIDIKDIDDDSFLVSGKNDTFKYQFSKLEGKYKEDKGWIFPNKSRNEVKKLVYKAGVGVSPTLSLNITKYVINEIFHCSFESEFSALRFPEISYDFSKTVSSMITSFIKDKKLKNSMIITSQTCDSLWRQICMLCENIYETASQSEEGEIEAINNVLNISQSSVENLKREYSDYGFNTETENCALQSVVYNIVAITDWLGTYDVKADELDTCISILTFGMNSLKSFNTIDNNEVNNISRAFEDKGLVIGNKTSGRILGFIKKISKESQNNKEVLNRIMFFSNII